MTNISFGKFMLIVGLYCLVNSIPDCGLRTAAADFDIKLRAAFHVLAVPATGVRYWLQKLVQG